MILSFKKQFERPIIHGTKIHTIREDKHDRWKAGNIIHFATGVRTKDYNQFMVGQCKSVQHICITNNAGGGTWCRIDGKYHGGIFVAQNDGLTFDDFINWFIPKQGDKFEGKIIHWTDFKYQ